MAPFFTVHHGLTYRAKLKLNFFEGLASNDQIAEKFQELGFIHISVRGSGDHRWAQGVWNGPDESVPLTDEHIESVIEVKVPKASKATMEAWETDDIDKKEKLGQHNPFNPAYPEANDNVTGGG